MNSYELAEELKISRRNLKYYVARYAKKLNWDGGDEDDLARIVLFRKLGFSSIWIKSLRSGKSQICEALDSCPRVVRHLNASVLVQLRTQQWTSLSFADCVALINSSALPTPKRDVLFLGRLLEPIVLGVVLGIVISGASFAIQHRWEDCRTVFVHHMPLVLVYLAAYVVRDEIVWRKRSR